MIVYKHITFLLLTAFCYPFITLYSLFNPNRNIWLVGENAGECLHDNGYFFFRFCTENTSENVYFVIKENSINYDDYLKKSGRALHYGSLKHIKYFLLATSCFFTHTYRDIAYKMIFNMFKGNCKKIFLRHGIHGFGDSSKWYRAHFAHDPDIYIISAQHEKKVMDAYYDLPERSIVSTGFARYDSLQKNDIPVENKTVLYIPTSRDWAIANYRDTIYFKKIESLLNNQQLKDILNKHDLTLKCYLHKKMRKCMEDLKPSQKILLLKPGDATVHELIKSSALMVTDYSSVSWDFFYLGKPVIFYQFDQEVYLKKQGAFVDYEDFIFGEVVTNEVELLSKLVHYAESEFKELQIHGEKRAKYFKFHDKNNCLRIYDAAVKLD